MSRTIDITGQRFGMWSVVRRAANRGNKLYYLCRCDCGTEKEVYGQSLRYGESLSCGCTSRERCAEKLRTMASRFSGEYSCWQCMKARCKYRHRRYAERYVGRGITICDRWRDSFEAFMADMGPRPSPRYSIDRIDNNGPYEPGNCRWATVAEQSRNTRANHLITLDGRTQCLTDWAREKGLNRHTVERRINAYSWTPERALNTPPRQWGR